MCLSDAVGFGATPPLSARSVSGGGDTSNRNSSSWQSGAWAPLGLQEPQLPPLCKGRTMHISIPKGQV